MRNAKICLIALALATILGSSAGAQIVLENHYLVYETIPDLPISMPILLADQFGVTTLDFAMLDKFANPVEKNQEPILDPFLHQTWWAIDDPQSEWHVTLENQFGLQNWIVRDGKFLVLPALKNQPGDLPLWNHYKCYEAVGPVMDIPVHLVDQFQILDVFVTQPAYFCNPTLKQVPEGEYPIVDPEAHLACYLVEPPMPFSTTAILYDQFLWATTLEVREAVWLCVPSLKHEAVATEDSNWSTLKSMYR